MIKARGLHRRYGSMTAVDKVDLDIPSGSIFCLIGPNGAGKTTILRMLATLLRPTSGEIEIDGIDTILEPLTARRRIGYLSDNFGLYDELLTWEYLDYFCGAYLVEDRAQSVEAVLDLVQLRHKRNEPVGKLSRGMRQRLGLARMLVYNPRVIILDEPANGLDPISRMALYALLRKLRDGGTTVLVSSHILTELSEICDHVGIMELGHMIVAGPVAEILAKTRTHLTLQLEVCGAPDGAIDLLKRLPGMMGVVLEGNQIQAQYSGKREDLPAVHQALVAAGIPVIAFSPRAENLEDLFLRLSTGATQ